MGLLLKLCKSEWTPGPFPLVLTSFANDVTLRNRMCSVATFDHLRASYAAFSCVSTRDKCAVHLLTHKWDRVVLDEGHSAKGPDTKCELVMVVDTLSNRLD